MSSTQIVEEPQAIQEESRRNSIKQENRRKSIKKTQSDEESEIEDDVRQ